MYINCKTFFSFRYGTFTTEELVLEAAAIGVSAMALTNINSTCDIWDFVKFCLQHQIKPVAGAEIRNEDTLEYILLAANNNGFRWINRFISQHLMLRHPFPSTAAAQHFFENETDGFVVYPIGKKAPEELLLNEYIGILPTEVNKLFHSSWKKFTHKLVLRQPVTFQNKISFNTHRLLRAIDKNTLLSKITPAETAAANETFLPPATLIQYFREYPFIVTNTYRLMDACEIKMEFGVDKNKKTFSATKNDDMHLLKKLAMDGLKLRYGVKNKEAAQRVDKELKVIEKLGFNAYFLITWDMIRYAQSRGFFYVGRGSGANSIVAYCLQITDVDPIGLDLYFERFMNPYRTTPPDFDIDFSWKDRDEVIDYMFKRYGEQHVALLGMYPTFQYNAVVRELGKVFGLPKTEIDQMAEKGLYYYRNKNGDYSNKKSEDHIQQLIFDYGSRICNFPNHLSIHPGGMLITEEPIHAYAATELPPKNFSTVQMDMFIAENVGIYKLDILSQRGLGHIREAINIIKENREIDVDIHAVEKFKTDPVVKKQIREVNTIGCFYIESPAMRQLLKKLECDDYLTLVAASSIIRPGVSQSGMMRQYIFRYHNPDKFEYLHPKMEELLKETYGVMVYQEDVIKVAHHFAGLDMGEADILRRAISGKYRGNKEMQRIKEQFFVNCKARGYADETSAEVWRQIESFGGYSFSKAHSASFAVESYQSLYLKSYYPMEFMVAVINNFGGFYSRELYFNELMKTGAEVLPPCVNNSEYYTAIRGKIVHAGFIHIKEMEEQVVEKIIAERKLSGNFLHLQDFIERTDAPGEQINLLIRIGAFRFTGKNKKQLLWEANFLQKKNKQHLPVSSSIFKEEPVQFTLPELKVHPLDDLFDEMEILGFPLRDPFQLVDDDPSLYTDSRVIHLYKGQTIVMLGYMITQKPVRTVKGETMGFGTFIDRNKDWIDTVHFPQVYRQMPLHTGFFRLKGRVVEEFGVFCLEVESLEKVGIKQRPAMTF
jgi:error-prone DNA polymerase